MKGKRMRCVAFMLAVALLGNTLANGQNAFAIQMDGTMKMQSGARNMQTHSIAATLLENSETSASDNGTGETPSTGENSGDATTVEQGAGDTTTAESTTAVGDTNVDEATTTEEATTEEIPPLKTTYKERRAVWFSFDDLDYKKKTKAYFTKQIQKSFDNVKSMGMNTVVCHVRPFGDAMYPSKYFPWSKIASGKQGRNPKFDPLAIMVREAHKRDLRFEAWINPYRVTLRSTNMKKLSKDNQAKKWYKKKSTKRNVLLYNGQYYYNPSKKAVRTLITNGVKEIVTNYPVDAIHFDDYFYPSFASWNYKTAFDGPEYKTYVKKQKKAHKTVKSIQSYRRAQVNQLIRQVYSAIKKINPDVEFGISPAGNLDNLRSRYSYYVDIDRWLKNDGYVDYICPQIYWGFDNGNASYDKVLNRWARLSESSDVDLYIGLAVYRTVYQDTYEWRKRKDIMKRSVALARKKSNVKGFYFFTYSSFTDKRSKKERKKLIKELKKKKDK